MKNLIALLTLFILVLFSNNCKAQTYDEPPKVSMANDKNQSLIDEIVINTGYESYFKNYCIGFITKTAKQEKWTTEKIKSVKAKINFTEFKVQKLYNWLSHYSTKQLNEFIELYKKDKKRDTNNIIRDDENIAKHLEWYAESLIQN